MNRVRLRQAAWVAALAGVLLLAMPATAATSSSDRKFPPRLESYDDDQMSGLGEVLRHRLRVEPFNLWATLLFLGAVIHTFMTHRFLSWSHMLEERHRRLNPDPLQSAARGPTCISARVLHFLGEVEAVFGIWVIPLLVSMSIKVGWQPTLNYLDEDVHYNEAVFVVVIMAISSTRPVLRLAEQCLQFFARLGGNTPAAWWFVILTLAPVLGSFITEPAAMTIAALLLGRRFYALKPPPRFAYATLGLLFVNVSVGGVLTHFAAPPVLMVAGPWQWNTPFMFRHFGWISLIGILLVNALYFAVFRRQFARLADSAGSAAGAPTKESTAPIPIWVTAGHILFMGWSVWNAHYPVLVVGGFLFFLAFFEVTSDHQSELQLRSPILVGFFLAGLVIHGGLQQWWLGPVLSRLSETPLMFGAIGLTAVNDNAAITYLASLVPDLADSMKYAVVAGAITGGGLTVIANAPNPAGQSILRQFFPDGISPLGLFLAALPATAVFAACFLLLG